MRVTPSMARDGLHPGPAHALAGPRERRARPPGPTSVRPSAVDCCACTTASTHRQIRWAKLTETERYSHRVLGAVLESRTSPIVSHISAAVLNGAPIIGPMPSLVHVLCTNRGWHPHRARRTQACVRRPAHRRGTARAAVDHRPGAHRGRGRRRLRIHDCGRGRGLGTGRGQRHEGLAPATLEELGIRRGTEQGTPGVRFRGSRVRDRPVSRSAGCECRSRASRARPAAALRRRRWARRHRRLLVAGPRPHRRVRRRREIRPRGPHARQGHHPDRAR